MSLKMSPSLIIRKAIILCIGLFVLAFGISLCSATNLGVSPSQSLSYVMHLVLSDKIGWAFFTWGICTTILNFLYFFGEIAIIRKDFAWPMCLQMVVVFVFSYFTDFTKAIVNLIPIGEQVYFVRLCIQILACAIIGLGIYLEVKADLIVMASEGFISAVAKVIHKDFGLTKIIVDWGCIALSTLISLLVFGGFNGVREGTLIAAFLNGYFVRIYSKHIKFLDKFVGSVSESLPEAAYGTAAYPLVITIEREFGSGGHIIGEALAKKLGINFYDYNLIEKTAKEAGLPTDDVANAEERLGITLLSRISQTGYEISNEHSKMDDIFHAQAKVIRDIAANESCIIMGRLGSYILKNRPNTMHIFLSADLDFKAKAISEKFNISTKEAEKMIKREDLMRVNYCKHFTGTPWGIAAHYGITLHTSDYGIDNSIKLLVEAMENATCRVE